MTTYCSDNKVATFEDLEPLKLLPASKELDLTGNPIADLSCYKAKLISMLNSLATLDGEDVTKEEVIEANAWAKAEEARLAAEAEAAAAAE